jgi:hypothetical protein
MIPTNRAISASSLASPDSPMPALGITPVEDRRREPPPTRRPPSSRRGAASSSPEPMLRRCPPCARSQIHELHGLHELHGRPRGPVPPIGRHAVSTTACVVSPAVSFARPPTGRRRPCVARNTGVFFAQNMQSMGGHRAVGGRRSGLGDRTSPVVGGGLGRPNRSAPGPGPGRPRHTGWSRPGAADHSALSPWRGDPPSC